MTQSGEAANPRVGQVAGFGPRTLAFLIDGVIADLIGALINGGFANSTAQTWTVLIAFLAIEWLFVSFAGQTPGMRIAGIGVLRKDRSGRIGVQWALLRTVLIAVIVPAVIPDSTGLCMHDRAAGSVILHTR